jgi:glyoxylase-like metal-dependent hydrolase (beta-lactamase superfamily II)
MKQFTRRHFNRVGFASAAALLVPNATIASATPFGGGTLLSFSDGQFGLPLEMLYSDAPEAQLSSAVAASRDKDGRITRPVNVNLLEVGKRKILFDAGSGVNFFPSLGKLPSVLESAGVEVSAITDVVLTHAHPDHIWGILDDFDDLLMPDANYYISHSEWEFWGSDKAISAMPAGRENFAVGAKSRFEKIKEQITLFSPGREVVAGIEAVDTGGHTPGHASFVLHSGSESIMILGDALTHPTVSFEYPKWLSDSDMDRQKAADVRLSLLDRLVADKIKIAATHLPAPGFGYVEKHQSAWRYIASETV